MEQLHQYVEKVISGVKPIIGAILATLTYIMFPDKAFVTAAFAVGGAILLDIVTKYIALSSKNHGFKNAARLKKIYSKTLWEGTRIKLVSYLIIAILVGLSYRVTMLTQVSVFLTIVVYSVVFLREAQSILENLCDAGAEWNPISLGVGYQGDFSKQNMTDEQLKAGIWLNSQLAKKYDLTVNDIVGHKKVRPTSCPGKNFRMQELHEGVARMLQDKLTLILNNKVIDLKLFEGRTYAPVREILETLEFKVN